MKKSYIILLVIAVVAIFLFFSGKSTYNKMTTQEQTVEKVWSQVQVQYQRRMDLIPNLVATVKGYAEHESSTFENVTRARAGLTDAYNQANQTSAQPEALTEQTLAKTTQAQQELNKALSIYVNAVREAYPDLKADSQFTDLQTQLEGTENRIATERNRYTEAVTEFNIMIKRFPANIWASIFGFTAKPQFQADSQAAVAPQVQF